ncbi:alpha-glucan water dikinase 2 isoform X1 [Helianthus annuus]|nr:alpha-glucan water dikinase 2 isoform X1 [Helianthus annuus]KAJ0528362.1 putative alpha-glucan, water dikinase [Helianthus annuus]
MASLKSGKCTEIKKFKFDDGMVLQVDVSVFSSGHNAKVKFQLQKCSQTWILHWGCIYNGNKKWFVPSFYPSGTTVYKKAALSTPFIKIGDAYVVEIELRDPKIHAIEFVLKNARHDKWLKMNGASFHINLHKEIEGKNDGARNGKCLLNETSHNENIEKPLRHRSLCSATFFPKLSTSSSTWQGLSQKNNAFSNMYVMSLEETSSEMVGEKSRSIRFLNNEGPKWMKFPASIVLPLGVFEKILSEDINKEVAKKIASLGERIDRGDISKLKTVQETVLQIKAPRRLSIEVRKKMKSSRLPWPRGRGDDTWTRVWQAMKMVWASKWNEGAYVSYRNTNTTYDKLRIGILIQEYIRADYAFVTYTHHPVSQDSSEIYTEIVKGSVETLVGASLGRPMCSVTKKSDLKSPTVTCYPSKSTGLYTKSTRSIIFRPDFIPENTNGYTCSGIYDSISMENKEEVVLDYSRDRLVTDLRFQGLIHSKIAETAKIIEDLYGCVQSVEGVVQDEQVYVLQCKPIL